MPEELPQAVVHRVINGGCKTPKRIAKQIKYLARINPNSKDDAQEDSEPAVKLRLSARYGEDELNHKDIDKFSDSWALQSGIYLPGQKEADSKKELTTHLAVSFPPGTPLDAAEKAGLEWANILFHSGRFGAEWDYITAFHTDRAHPHMHVVVNRRGFPPENSGVSAMGKWLKIAHRYEPDKMLAAENGKEFGINYTILRDVQVEAAAKFGIRLEATSRKERGLDTPSLTHGQYRQQQKDGLGEVVEHRGHIRERAFGGLLDEKVFRLPPEVQGAVGQAGGEHSDGSSGGPTPERDSFVSPGGKAATQEPGTAADEPIGGIERSSEAAVDQPGHDADGVHAANEKTWQASSQPNEEPDRGPLPRQSAAIEPKPEHAAMQQQRRKRAEEQRDREANEGPRLRKTPGGVELQNPAVDSDRHLAATQERRERTAEQRAHNGNDGPSRRKTPRHGILENSPEPGNRAKDEAHQRNSAATQARPKGERPNGDLGPTIAPRAQEVRQGRAEANQSSPTLPFDRIPSRDTEARKNGTQRDRQGPAALDHDGNTRPGIRRGRRRRSNHRRSR